MGGSEGLRVRGDDETDDEGPHDVEEEDSDVDLEGEGMVRRSAREEADAS